MKCADAPDRIARYLGGDLPVDAVAGLLGHIESCARCRAELALQRSLATALAEEPEALLRPGFAGRTAGLAFRRSRNRRRNPYALPALTGAAFGAAIAASILLGTVPSGRSAADAWYILLQTTGRLGEGATHLLSGAVLAPEGVLGYAVLGLLAVVWGFHHIFAGLTE